jgi:hypothetical protein
MRVRVRLHPMCRFDIGERTRETRSLVRDYVSAFRKLLGAHAGRPPGVRQIRESPPTYVWEDRNWRFAYTAISTAKSLTVTIFHVRLNSRRDRP